MNKSQEIKKYSNPTEVYKRAARYLGKTAKISLSTKRDKKYMVITPQGKDDDDREWIDGTGWV